MYSFPSTSEILEPLALLTKSGGRPTRAQARTGLFTPPGMALQERSNARRDLPSWNPRVTVHPP